MNPLDIAILLMVGIISVRGLKRGFIRGTVDVFGWLAAMVIASRFAPRVAELISGTAIAPVATGAAFSITFMVAMGAIGMAAGIVFKTMGFLPRIPPFGFLNSVLGIAPGVVKGAMLASVVLAPLLAYEGMLGTDSPVSESVLAHPLVDTVNGFTNGALTRAGVDPDTVNGGMSLP
jgi:uncharacterized membrane protein required for colicin V production